MQEQSDGRSRSVPVKVIFSLLAISQPSANAESLRSFPKLNLLFKPFLLDRVPVSDALNAAKSIFELVANLFVSETLYSLNISAII